MGSIMSFLKSQYERRYRYLKDEHAEIAANNISTLRYASTLAVILLIALIALAFLLIDNWTPSVFHLLMLPASLLVCAIAWLTKDTANYRMSIVLCALFQTMLYACVILIDTLGGPNAPSSFVQLVCIALPPLFVMPARITYGLLGAAELLYACMVLVFKNPYIAQYDIYGVLAGVFFSLCVSQLMMASRLNAHDLKLRYEAMSKQDTLSSLYNKRAFFDAARTYLEKRNPNSSCSLSIIDIDNFKGVNDTFGHGAGDRVLSRMGDILIELYRPTDLIARFGGDEFMVLADRMVDDNIIRRRYEKLATRLAEESIAIIGTPITISMGTVLSDDQDVDFSKLLKQADEELYAAKKAGKSRCAVKRYHEGRTNDTSDR